MLAAVLALASSLSWGLSDFLGGFQSRRHSLLSVLVLSQGFALVVLGAGVAAGAPIGHDAAATAWAVGSGMLGGAWLNADECASVALNISRSQLIREGPRGRRRSPACCGRCACRPPRGRPRRTCRQSTCTAWGPPRPSLAGTAASRPRGPARPSA